MKSIEFFINLLDTHSDSQVKESHKELIHEYLNFFEFKYSEDKKSIIGFIPDSEGNLIEIEENIEIDVISSNLFAFEQALYLFKKELNIEILEARIDMTKLEYLNVVKIQLLDLESIFNEKLPESKTVIIPKILNPAIEFVSNYINQLNTTSIIVLEPPKKLNWNGNINLLGKFIKDVIEPTEINNNSPLITNHLLEIIDFISENFTWQGAKINKESLNRSTREDKKQNPDTFHRKRKPSTK
jgi:hypothetical protein